MQINFRSALALVLKSEGGFVNDPQDPGGATNRGVTQAVYDAYRRNNGKTPISVLHIADSEVADIYRNQYWRATCDNLPSGLDYAVFDYSVNSGCSHAVSDLQRVLNANGAKLKVDGSFGEGTQAAVSRVPVFVLIDDLCDRRLTFLKSLKTFKRFGKGWTDRVATVRKRAIAMASRPTDAANAVPTPLPPPSLATTVNPAPKADPADVAIHKTATGVGAIASGIAVSGTTAIEAAQQVKPHINDSLLGKLCLIGFILLMIFGVGLTVFQWYQKQKEKVA